MSTEPLLGCPVWRARLAGDTFCEACGAEVGVARDAARHRGDRPWDRGRHHRPRLGAPA